MTELTLDIESAVRRRFESIKITRSLHMTLRRLAIGEAELAMPNDDGLHGIFESLHGGILMTLADTAACVAILTRISPDEVITTTDMNIRFLAPCLSDVTAGARIIKFGRSLVPVNVALRDNKGREIALAQVTYMRLDRMPNR
jgi:uncharacterized protein (TIGR00369 family)